MTVTRTAFQKDRTGKSKTLINPKPRVLLMKPVWYIIIIITILAFASSIFFYSSLPDQMATHWNTKGEVDGHMSRFWGAFLMPIILIAMALLFAAVPIIDPLKKNIQKFRKYFDYFIILIFLFMLLMHGIVLAANLGYNIKFNIIMPIALAFLFFYIGILLEKAKRNWFIGIRTPWTLSSDKVWDKTHKLGARLFKLAAIIALIGAIFPDHSFWFILVPVISFTIIVLVYSYVEYSKLKKK
jgi:uncharacterized membrane protein